MMTLNYAVLFLILRVAAVNERYAASSLMRTCRTMYQEGVTRGYLFRYPIQLGKNTQQLISFHQFMLVDSPSRYRFLRHLILTTGYSMRITWKDIPTSSLESVLKDAHHLETLHIQETETLFRYHANIRRAISSLQYLSVLCMERAGLKAMQLLKRMHSHIIKLDISFRDDLIDPIPALINFQSTLEELTLEDVEVNTADLPFPRVETLSIENCANIGVRNLIQSFPNVKNISFRSFHAGAQNLFSGDHFAETIRQENRLFQLQSDWSKLEYICADVVDVYLLAFTRQIRHLRTSIYNSFSVHLLGDVLEELRPTRLSLNIIYFDGMSNNLPSLIPHTSLSRLAYVDIKFQIPSSGEQLVELIKGFLLSLRHLSTVHLIIHLQWEPPLLIGELEWESETDSVTDSYPDVECRRNPVEEYLTDLRTNPLDAISSLAQDIPNLQYVFFDISIERCSAPQWSFWHVVQGEGGPSIQKLSAIHGEEIMQSAQ